MQTEVGTVASFWLKYLTDASISPETREALRLALIDTLSDKYEGHWHLDKTNVGSGYRSMSNWRSLDSVLVEAAQRAQVPVSVLERTMPRDVVLWCDPYSVTYRVGDHGSVFTLYEDKRGLMESVKAKVAKSNGAFVISAYSTPVVIRSADGVEISRRGGASAPHHQYQQQGSPTKSAVAAAANFRRANAMSPLRHVSNYRSGEQQLHQQDLLASPSPAPLAQKSLLGANTRWSPSAQPKS
ncbi:hypothetical protein IWW37_000610 [Coemansia sp. RSA 2050]|nr:hypothetical protein IWW37_000610 [Coemansia sp. RSA 2050]KAJ2732249.1 hypothetical protein IW152_003969 [Coemansia sp. BCRC 34962]